ncbi:MAG: PTS sugar transporter subunit IIA [Candidatus Mcinerneyibacterium aminivorans]|uniref:PTS sugar transporter subunit IIA n=1 Tax=Candidatus Mcinerneyibacterium aminivorans TaxID=2703815 RepID=A0A5D0MBR2_9BACT|nr:MAG: PTS sugar transporter subunit IIA [Candidatus Mcinerneyibacterium aminivorans]
MLSNHITKNHIFLNPKVENKDELFKLLSQKAKEMDLIDSSEKMIEGIREQEKSGVMELKPNIVLPHARGEFVNELFVFVAISKKGLNYKGAQKNKSNAAFFIGVPPGNKTYLQLLASLSRFVKNEDLLENIINADIKEDISHQFKKFDSLHMQEERKKHEEKKYFILLSINVDIDDETISSFFAEIGIEQTISIDGRNLDIESSFFSIIPSIGFSTKKEEYSYIYMGITSNENAANKLYGLLKSKDIDLSENKMGTLVQLELFDSYGGYGKDIF